MGHFMKPFENERHEAVANLSQEPFGKELAHQVGNILALIGENSDKYMKFYNQHKEYCGHGLIYQDHAFHLVEVADGSPYQTLATWNSLNDFVTFFSVQSDHTCSGADPAAAPYFKGENNQRITRSRLEHFVQVNMKRPEIVKKYQG